MEDHYTILDVPPTASRQEIEAAWRRAVKMWHPDRNSSIEAKVRLQAINTARGTLVDDLARRRYDRENGFNRPSTPNERMKPPVRPGDHANGSPEPVSSRATRENGSGAQRRRESEAPKPAAANSEWWARFADAAQRNAEKLRNEAIRTAAEVDRADSAIILERRPRFRRYVIMPAGAAAIVIAAVLTLILV